VAGCCEYGNEPSGSIKAEKFLDQLRDYYHVKKDSALWSYLQHFSNKALEILTSTLTRSIVEVLLKCYSCVGYHGNSNITFIVLLQCGQNDLSALPVNLGDFSVHYVLSAGAPCLPR